LLSLHSSCLLSRAMGGCASQLAAVRPAVGGPAPAKDGAVPTSSLPGQDYDRLMCDEWGGPMPRLYPAYLETWPSKYCGETGSHAPKTALVTGGTSGIGFYAVKMLATLGFQVIVPRRPGFQEEAEAAVKAIKAEVPDAKLIVLETSMDLASFETVRAFAAHVRRMFDCLDVLCLNAGRGGASGDEREVTEDGLEAIMQVNLLSHALLCHELLPLLRASPHARIALHTSIARLTPFAAVKRKLPDINGTNVKRFNAFDQYRLSKAGLCLFMQGLNSRLQQAGVDNVIACIADPGLAATGINFQHNLGHSMLLLPDGCLSARRLHGLGGQHAADGALPLLLACVADGIKRDSWYTPCKGSTGAPILGNPKKHAQALNDPLNKKSLWPSNSAEVLWVQMAELTGTEWQF